MAKRSNPAVPLGDPKKCYDQYKKCLRNNPGAVGQTVCLARYMGCVIGPMLAEFERLGEMQGEEPQEQAGAKQPSPRNRGRKAGR